MILALLEALPAFYWNVVHRFKLQKGSCFDQSLSFSFGLPAGECFYDSPREIRPIYFFNEQVAEKKSHLLSCYF